MGAAAIAQADIEKYYVSLLVLRVVRWLIARGAFAAHATCVIRHQMCPKVILRYSFAGKATFLLAEYRGIERQQNARVFGSYSC